MVHKSMNVMSFAHGKPDAEQCFDRLRGWSRCIESNPCGAPSEHVIGSGHAHVSLRNSTLVRRVFTLHACCIFFAFKAVFSGHGKE